MPNKNENTDIDFSAIVAFLCRAKKATYAGHGAETTSSRKNSHDLIYKEANLMYYDTYLGGERFSGEEAVWKDDAPIWAMNYTGRVLDDKFSGDFLKEALSQISEETPYRGPLVYHKANFSYHCSVNGCFNWFNGYEEIFYGSKKIYECLFHGGAVK